MLLCDSGVDVSSSLLLASAILMAVREQLFHSSRCLNFRNRLRYESLAKRISDASADIAGFFEWEGDIRGLPIDNLYERKSRLYGYLANLGYGAPRAHDRSEERRV